MDSLTDTAAKVWDKMIDLYCYLGHVPRWEHVMEIQRQLEDTSKKLDEILKKK
jgi:hypothetical protein